MESAALPRRCVRVKQSFLSHDREAIAGANASRNTADIVPNAIIMSHDAAHAPRAIKKRIE
jgi:hypothetical protein